MKDRQQLRFFFQIRIDEKHMVAARPGETGHHGLVMAEIAGQIDHANARIPPEQRERNVERRVGRPIVHEHDFIVVGQRRRSGTDAAVELFEMCGRLIQGADD